MGHSTTHAPAIRFQRALEGFDGDWELFAGLAPEVADRYEISARQLQELAAQSDLDGLARAAHRIRATWGLYAEQDEDRDLADRLELAARTTDTPGAVALAELLADCLEATARDLRRARDP